MLEVKQNCSFEGNYIYLTIADFEIFCFEVYANNFLSSFHNKVHGKLLKHKCIVNKIHLCRMILLDDATKKYITFYGFCHWRIKMQASFSRDFFYIGHNNTEIINLNLRTQWELTLRKLFNPTIFQNFHFWKNSEFLK